MHRKLEVSERPKGSTSSRIVLLAVEFGPDFCPLVSAERIEGLKNCDASRLGVLGTRARPGRKRELVLVFS